MKKLFFLAVAAVVALAACTKNEADTTAFEQAKVINFNTVANKATKAYEGGPISGNVYSYDLPSFGVFASYLAKDKTWASDKASATRYMDDVEVKFNDTKDIWAPASTYYWPLEGSLSFIAYSPKAAATAAFAEATGTLTLTGFTVNTTVASQVDLLYSSIAADKDQNESYYQDSDNHKDSHKPADSGYGEGDTGVNIKFKHALAQIIFKAKAADDVYAAGMSFKINTITVNAASTADKMTVDNPADTDLACNVTTWTNPKTPADFAVRSADFPNATVEAGAANFLTDELSAPIGDALLMIPSKKEVTPATDPATYTFANDPTVTIKYTLYRMDPVLAMGSKTVTIHFDDIDDVVKCWEAGKKYVYNLTIDLQKIYFNPTITDWVNGGSQDVDIPTDARP